MKIIVFHSILLAVHCQIIVSINCGGDEYIDSKGNIWSKDRDYEGGQVNFINDNRYIRFTNDPYLYMSERQHTEDFYYHIPMLETGDYVIILKFLEYFNVKGKKTTNFFIGKQVVHGEMEVFQGLTDSAAIDEYILITVNNSKIFWDGKIVKDAVKNEKILFRFAKNLSELARINGIMVVKGGLEDTEYFEYIKKVKKFRQLVHNKAEISERPLQFPKDHQVLYSATLYSVICKYPFAIIFTSIAFYLILSKLISLEA